MTDYNTDFGVFTYFEPLSDAHTAEQKAAHALEHVAKKLDTAAELLLKMKDGIEELNDKMSELNTTMARLAPDP